MQRPKRQAAETALQKIREIREWEILPESSQTFKDCAARIDAELDSEIRRKKVKTEDLDASDDDIVEEEHDKDCFYDAQDGFVVFDNVMSDDDPDFCLNKKEELGLENNFENDSCKEEYESANDLSESEEESKEDEEEGSEAEREDPAELPAGGKCGMK
jgi:hypothetical protein